jgi:hypothetical protein
MLDGPLHGVVRALIPPSATATRRYRLLAYAEYMTFAWLYQIPVLHSAQDCAKAVMAEAGEVSIRLTFRPRCERHA